jgi:hypothetical protein
MPSTQEIALLSPVLPNAVLRRSISTWRWVLGVEGLQHLDIRFKRQQEVFAGVGDHLTLMHRVFVIIIVELVVIRGLGRQAR